MHFHSITVMTLFLTLFISGCGKKEDEKTDGKPVTVNATALALTSKVELNKLGSKLLAGPKSPSYSEGEYDGMGVLTSDAIVESFKVKLNKVTFGSKTKSAGEFPITDGELDISGGVNQAISVTGNLASGSWDRVNIGFEPYYKLKAYAYMDSNNDGTMDTTVFTTATEVKKSASRLTKAQMISAGYAEYKYGYLYVYCSNSTTNSTGGNCNTISVFPEPFSIDDPIETQNGETTPPATHVVNILIDSTKVVTAWTGGVGSYQVNGTVTTSSFLGNGTSIPSATNFPASDVCSTSKNEWGLNDCDFYKIGTPAFRLQYLPAFAFLSTANLTSQIYLVSTESGNWNHYNTGVIQLVFKNNKPLFGLIFPGGNTAYDRTVSPPKISSSATPILGSSARLFEETSSNTYTFYMDGSSKDSSGNDDGGLYYNNDKTMAGHIVENFKPLSVSGTGTISVKDGPRCKGEYDTCLGARTYYVKRLK